MTTTATTHEILGRLETVTRWIDQLQGDLTGELAVRRDLIMQARAAGASVVDIAKACHVTRQTIHRIIATNS